MTTTIIAAIAALAGTVVAGLMQHLTTTRATRAATAERQRQALAHAIPALLTAIVQHREQQYLKIEARRNETGDTPEARRLRYAARSTVTSAMDTLHMVTPDQTLLAAAQNAVDAAMAIGDVPADELDTAGVRARETHTALRILGATRLHP